MKTKTATIDLKTPAIKLYNDNYQGYTSKEVIVARLLEVKDAIHYGQEDLQETLDEVIKMIEDAR